MLHCKSMYHGGELVEAIDVSLDFDSYKELGLLCPFCDEPVFLCGETVRQSRKTGKLSYIQPHFKHFAGGDPMGLTCEKRYYTAEGKRYLDAIRAERRGQRLELFNQYFLEIAAGYTFPQIKKYLEMISLKVEGRKISLSLENPAIKIVWEQWLKEKELMAEIAKAELSTLWDPNFFNIKMQDAETRFSSYKTRKNECLEIRAANLSEVSSSLTSCDRKIHELIVWDALSFLSTRQGAKAWLGLFGASLAVEYLRVEQEGDAFDQSSLRHPARLCADIIAQVVSRPWQQQLEEKAKLKKHTRAKGFRKSA